MSSTNITPINTINLQKKYCTLSNYAQRFVKSQVKSISFVLEKFFLELDLKLISQNEQKLKDIGIKQIGNDIKAGVVISDNKYDYHVFLSNDGFYTFDILELDSNQVKRHFSIKNNSDEYRHAGNFSGLNAEDELSRILDFVDDKLLKAKKECLSVPILQPLIQSNKKLETNKIVPKTKKNTDIKNAGFIGSKEEELIKLINDKFQIIQGLYKNISDGRTKYELRCSYKNYMPQPVANKLGFKDAGPKGEAITLFQSAYKNNSYTAVTLIDADGKDLKFVISNDNRSVRKNFPSQFVKSDTSGYRICLTPDYYTQDELNALNLPLYLSILNKEMEKFIEHTQNWFNKKEEIKLIKSNYDSATLDQYKDLLDDIHTNFENYREKMRKYLRKTHKSKKFKKENDISTKLASTAVKFDNITPDGYDLRLSYPKVHDSNATQLLIMKDDKIEKSFYILNNKLLRFSIRDLNDKLNYYNRKLYYYDNKYLQDSNLYGYLLLIQNKLHELNEKLDTIRKKQIENRIKYHIKTQKD